MTTDTPTLQWSEKVPPNEVRTGEQLDLLLDHLAAISRPDSPISVRLQAHGCRIDILLGLPESFVYFDEVNPTRYYITIGNVDAEGLIGFHLLGEHNTEFERRHLIPFSTARSVLREFFDTGHRPTSVEWEEGSY